MTWRPTQREAGEIPAACGDTLVRLDQIPWRVRRAATERLVARGAVDEEQAARLLELLVDPGDAGGRLALRGRPAR